MANNINLDELRAQRAGRISKASEEAVEKFIETGEVTPEPVDPRQQSFFKEEPAAEEASVVETVVQEKVSEELVAQQSPVQRFIQEETQKEAENEEVESTNMSEMELYGLLKKSVTRRRDRDGRKKEKIFKTYSVSLPCAMVELIDKMAANRYMTRSSLLTICLMNGLELELGIDAKKSLPLPLKS